MYLDLQLLSTMKQWNGPHFPFIHMLVSVWLMVYHMYAWEILTLQYYFDKYFKEKIFNIKETTT